MVKFNDYTNSGKSGIVSFAAEYLGISADAELIMVADDRLLERFSTGDIRFEAILHAISLSGKYRLVVRSRTREPLDRILLHEMVHLSQYLSGMLSLDIDRNVYTWQGREYGPEIQYDRRPWEIEAFAKSRKMEKEWKNLLKEEKKNK